MSDPVEPIPRQPPEPAPGDELGAAPADAIAQTPSMDSGAIPTTTAAMRSDPADSSESMDRPSSSAGRLFDSRDSADAASSSASINPPPAEPEPAEEIHLFESSGISERAGRVPAWLVCVYVFVLLWGAYYLYRYADPAPDGRGRRVPVVDDLLGRWWPWGAPESEPEGEREKRESQGR